MLGVPLACAVLEHLVYRNKSLVIFATHYLEMIKVAKTWPIGFHQTTIHKSADGAIQCLYRIQAGVINESHGIDMAEKAGLPASVIKSAKMFRDGGS
jgi:DNA mismatch repair protein MutS